MIAWIGFALLFIGYLFRSKYWSPYAFFLGNISMLIYSVTINEMVFVLMSALFACVNIWDAVVNYEKTFEL